MSDLLQHFLNTVQWLNNTDDENLEIFEECCHRFTNGSLSDHKIVTIAGHLEISGLVLKESLISMLRLAMNRLHLKKKGPSTIENAILSSRIVEARRPFIIDLVASLSSLDGCRTLLDSALAAETRGTYQNSTWRMDIDISQRSSQSLDPAVNFVCKLQLATGTTTLNFTPAMLVKLEAELQNAVNAVNKAKIARI